MLTKFIAMLALIAVSLLTSYFYFTKAWGMSVHSWMWFFILGYLIPAITTPLFAKVQGELAAEFKK